MQLYHYWRSSASYRVRIALHLKAIDVEMVAVDLIADGGEQYAQAYRAINPQARVPALVLDDGTILTQSPAIIEWLDETYPRFPFLPEDRIARANIRAAASLIACDIHPLNNISVLSYLRQNFTADDEAIGQWYRHWIATGFAALEQMIAGRPFCFGASPGLADIMLVPQLANARRFATDLSAYPGLLAAEAACLALPAFAKASPEACAP